MGTVQFVRQLGAQPGVQLNAVQDQTGLPSSDQRDQRFAMPLRLTRGRIDKAFLADKGNFRLRCGKGESIRSSALNEAQAQAYEALHNGAMGMVASRLITPDAELNWVKIKLGGGAQLTATLTSGAISAVTVVSGGNGYTSGSVSITVSGGGGSGATLTPVITNGAIASVTVGAGGSGYTTAPTLTVVPATLTTTFVVGTGGNDPGDGSYDIAVKHLDCHNDGIIIELHADVNRVGGANTSNPEVTLRIKDVDGLVVLGPFTGSLTAGATDDYGNSYYLPDVIEAQTDRLEILVATNATVRVVSDAYGYSAAGQQEWATSDVLDYFDEGGTGYDADDYAAACDRLRHTDLTYGYIAGGGTQADGLLAALAQLAFDTERQFRFDVPGSLAPDAAVEFVEALGIITNENGHLIHAFWNPQKATDPSGVNGKGYLGTSAFNIARACYRNSQTNSYGFAPKNFPIAGKNWPLTRANITQTYFPSEQELSALAHAKINPVLHSEFSGGAFTVFTDSLTMAQVANSKRMLIAVADMMCDIEDRMVRIANDALQLPMDYFLRQVGRELGLLGTGAAASKWVLPLAGSADDSLATNGYAFTVTPAQDRPYDTAEIVFYGNFDGTVRQIRITPILAGTSQ